MPFVSRDAKTQVRDQHVRNSPATLTTNLKATLSPLKISYLRPLVWEVSIDSATAAYTGLAWGDSRADTL